MKSFPWKRAPFSSLFALICLLLPAAAQEEKKETPRPALPANVKVEAGKISMVADFASKQKEGTVPVFILNGTASPLVLESQDWDIYLKLEVQEADGTWKRAQPHQFSWCGNSYVPAPAIKARDYAVYEGYQPAQGESRTVRYRLYHQDIELVSNTGTALVAAKDIDLASRDALSVMAGDFDYVSKVALGTLKPVNEMDHITDLQQVAISKLTAAKFDAAKSRAVLLQVKAAAPEKAADVAAALEQLDTRARSKSKEGK